MLGVNHRVRKTPLRSRTTKLHSAISPSMNDQWSGKTLRRFFLARVASPRRSSAHSATAPTGLGFEAVAAVLFVVATLLVSMLMSGSLARALLGVALPVARSDRFLEVALRHEVALVVHHQRQLGERPAGGPEDVLRRVGQVERRLVARAEQVVGLLLVQRDRAADVGADLGVAEDPVDGPVLPARGGVVLVGVHAYDDDRGLGLGDLQGHALEQRIAVLVDLEDRLRLGVDQVADLEVAGPDRSAD